MKIRIYETDFEGHPVEYTGEFFAGKNATDIVEQMKMNPFTGSLKPLDFMRQVLDSNGQKEAALPENENAAAVAFLQRLTATGFAKFELDDGELDMDHPAPFCPDGEKGVPFPEKH